MKNVSHRTLILTILAALAGCQSVALSPAESASLRYSPLTGTYQGVFPCADCTGIDTVLTLNADGSYQLETNYLGKTTQLQQWHNGRWLTHNNNEVIELDAEAQRSGGSRVCYIRSGRNKLIKYDAACQPMTTDSERYQLEKIRAAD